MKICALAIHCILICGLLSMSCADTGGPSSVNVPVTSQPAAAEAPGYNISLVDPLYESTAGAKAIAVGDLNNDGTLDFASISSESQRVQIHLQNPLTGEFETIAVGGGAPITLPTAIELADLNGDGKLDIIVLVADTGFAGPGGESTVGGALVMFFQGANPRKPTDWSQIPGAGASPPANLALPGGDGVKTGPTALLVGPLDARPGSDIAVVYNGSGTNQVVLFSNPGGAFATNVNMWASTPIELDISRFAGAALADLDNDGDLDIAMSVPAAKSFNLRWLENPMVNLTGNTAAGTPTYAPDPLGSVFESTARAKAVVLGDINNDGKVDVASISGDSQPVQIHLRDATTGLFKTYSIASGPPLQSLADVALADLNGDAKLDIILLVSDTGLAAGTAQPALVFLIQGTDPTKPSDWQMVPSMTGSFPRNLLFGSAKVGNLVVGDVDGANGLDVIVTTEGSIRLFRNPGNAGATDANAWTATVLETNATEQAKVDLADVDKDGDKDVVISDAASTGFNVRWLANPLISPPPAAAAPPTFLADLVRPDLIDPQFEATAGATAVVSGDINNDGTLDIASISNESQAVQIHLRNPSTGRFDPAITIAGGGPLAKMNAIRLTDLNNDGKLDLVVLVNDSGFAPPPAVTKVGALGLLIQGADPKNPADWTPVNFTNDPRDAASPFYFLSNAAGLVDVVVGDFTGDGLVDIVVASNEDPGPPHTAVYLLTNPGAGLVRTTAAWNRVPIENEVPNYSRLAVLDVDKDGDLDVVVTLPTSKTFNIHWLQNNGVGNPWTPRFIAQQQGGGDFVALGDIDGDGNVDVAVSGATLLLTQWFRNPGPAALATGAQYPWSVFTIGEIKDIPGKIDQVQLADLNSDGKLECFVTVYDDASATGTAVGYQRDTNVQDNWKRFPIDSLGAEFGRVAFADFDANGRLEFIAPLQYPGLTLDRIAFYAAVTDDRWLRNVVGQQENGANFMAVGDIDGDGNPDVAVSSTSQGITQWFRNPGATILAADGGQVPWKVFNIGDVSSLGGKDLSNVQLVDLDANGTLDCVVTAGGVIASFLRATDVQEDWAGFLIDSTDAAVGRMAFADLNGDGLPDFIAPLDRPGTVNDRIVIYTLIAQSHWARRLIGQQPGSNGAIAVADIDGDGNMDIATAAGTLTQWFRNPGKAAMQAIATQVPWDVFNIGDVPEGQPDQVELVDLDSNGKIQCFVSGGGKAWGFTPQADIQQYWTLFPLFTTAPVADVGRVGFGDFNRDGRMDFVAPVDRTDGLVRDQFILFLRK